MTADALTLTVTVDGDGGPVVRITGEIDLATAPQLQRGLEDLGTTGRVTVDMSAVDFMDSTGLATLLRHSVRMRDDGGSLAIIQASANVRRLFEFCCLDHLLTDSG